MKEVNRPNRGPVFEAISYSSLWTAELHLSTIDLESFKDRLAEFVQQKGVPVLGYLWPEPNGGMRYSMSRYPDFRSNRPPMSSIEVCNRVAESLATAFEGTLLHSAQPQRGLRAVVGLREGGYHPDAPIQDIQRVVDDLPACRVTPAHMVACRFEYNEDGLVVPDHYDEPVAIVEAETGSFAQIGGVVDGMRQQHCPVEDFDRRVITMYETAWARMAQ